jgi:ribA/ribD-fused uncharacterized protein
MPIQLNAKDWNLATTNWFWKTRETNGFLSNMCAGYPLTFGTSRGRKVSFHTSEALYQAARFSSHPLVQEQIAQEKNPMRGKMIARKFNDLTRPDWFDIRVSVMKWVVYQKWFQHQSFRDKMAALDMGHIVEFSSKDDFWGAKPTQRAGIVHGANVLGQILQFRKDFKWKGDGPTFIAPGFSNPLFFNDTLIAALPETKT